MDPCPKCSEGLIQDTFAPEGYQVCSACGFKVQPGGIGLEFDVGLELDVETPDDYSKQLVAMLKAAKLQYIAVRPTMDDPKHVVTIENRVVPDGPRVDVIFEFNIKGELSDVKVRKG